MATKSTVEPGLYRDCLLSWLDKSFQIQEFESQLILMWDVSCMVEWFGISEDTGRRYFFLAVWSICVRWMNIVCLRIVSINVSVSLLPTPCIPNKCTILEEISITKSIKYPYMGITTIGPRARHTFRTNLIKKKLLR